MLARRGSSTRIPAGHPRAELAGAARPLRRSQGRRDPGAPPRGRRTAPTQSPPRANLGRPRDPQRAEQAAAYAAAPVAARLAEDPAALARPPRETTTRASAHPAADPGPGAADGPGEPQLGLPNASRASGSDSAT